MRVSRIGKQVTIGIAASLLGVLLIAVGPAALQAQQPLPLRPVAVVSFNNLESLLTDVDYLGKLAGVEGLSQTLKNAMGESAGAPGVDNQRPFGVAVLTDGFQFLIYGYVPVTNFSQLTDWLAQKGIELTQTGQVWSAMLPNGQEVKVAERNGWAVISANEEALKLAGPNPPDQLMDLTKRYDVAVALTLSNVPPLFKQLGLSMIQQGMEMAMQQQAEATGQDVEAQKQMMQRSFQQMQVLLDELESMTFGLKMNEPAAALVLDMETAARPGTQSARDLSANQNLKSRLLGFVLPDAILMARTTSQASPRDVEQLKLALPQYRRMMEEAIDKAESMSNRERKLMKNFLNTILNSLQATMEKGRFDAALSAAWNASAKGFLFGMVLADAEKVEKEFLAIAQRAMKDDPKAKELIKLDAETYQGFRFHVLQIPTSELTEMPENIRQQLGDQLALVIAFSSDMFALSGGPDAVNLLKKAIDQTSEEKAVENLAEFVLKLKPIFQFVAAEGEDEESRLVGEQWVKNLGEKDQIRGQVTVQGEKSTARLELDEGLTKALITAIVEAAQKAQTQQAVPFGVPMAP